MEKQTFTKEEIQHTLARVYREAFVKYATLDALATEMYGAGESEASEVVRRYAYNRSSFCDGVIQSAEALGIDPRELREAVTSGGENT